MNMHQVEEIIHIFEKSSIEKLVVGDKEFSVTLQKDMTIAPVVELAPQALAPVLPPPKADVILKSNGVGFFRQIVPLQDIQAGVTVAKGKSIFSVTSMKLEHEQSAEKDCKVLEYLVSNGHPVEYGQPVVRIEWV